MLLFNWLYTYIYTHIFTHIPAMTSTTTYFPVIREVDNPIATTVLKPYPLLAPYSMVTSGFGRGSSELGCPTANVDPLNVPFLKDIELPLGVYFGYARLRENLENENKYDDTEGNSTRKVEFNYGSLLNATNGDLDVIPVVLSVGKNPFYGNTHKTVELHLLHKFEHNFYGADISFAILGYIRPELDYKDIESLMNDINTDIDISRDILQQPGYTTYKELLQ